MVPQVFRGLSTMLGSERGVYALGVLVCASVLTGLGHLSSLEWSAVAVGSQGIYSWAKTVRPSAPPKDDAPPAPGPPKEGEDL